MIRAAAVSSSVPLPVFENTVMSLNRRSKNITEGVARAPNRSMYYAMGYE